MQQYKVLDVYISAVTLKTACDAIFNRVALKQRAYICVAPVSTVVDARKDKEYRDVVNAAMMTVPDGMPIVWLGKKQFGSQVERTCGPDLMLALCKQSQAKNIRHFLFGSTQEVLNRLESNLKERFPQLIICGKISPKFTQQAQELSEEEKAQINDAQPDIIWVGLGSPKQDFWMAKNRQYLKAPILIGVGAAFDIHAGLKSLGPTWMQNMGLAWLFRLCSEPRRLWKRYLIGNIQFLWWLLLDKCSIKKAIIKR